MTTPQTSDLSDQERADLHSSADAVRELVDAMAALGH